MLSGKRRRGALEDMRATGRFALLTRSPSRPPAERKRLVEAGRAQRRRESGTCEMAVGRDFRCVARRRRQVGTRERAVAASSKKTRRQVGAQGSMSRRSPGNVARPPIRSQLRRRDQRGFARLERARSTSLIGRIGFAWMERTTTPSRRDRKCVAWRGARSLCCGAIADSAPGWNARPIRSGAFANAPREGAHESNPTARPGRRTGAAAEDTEEPIRLRFYGTGDSYEKPTQWGNGPS